MLWGEGVDCIYVHGCAMNYMNYKSGLPFTYFRFTAADCVLGYNMWWAGAMQGGILLQNHPALLEYYKRLSRRSGFQRVFETDVVATSLLLYE